MADSPPFNPLAPGFDFLQSMVKNAGAAMPGMGQWVAPTLNPEEIEKRIDELKTVQFWLEQNARLLGATIQALEVQRMTLTTLKTMNVQFGDLREAMKIRVPTPTPTPDGAADPAASPEAAPESADAASAAPAAATPPNVVDPMQWWGALTKQFTELASAAIQPAPANGVAPNPAAPEPKRAASKTAAAKKTPAAKTNPARKRAAPPRP